MNTQGNEHAAGYFLLLQMLSLTINRIVATQPDCRHMRPYDRVWSPVPISMEFYAPPGRTVADRRARPGRGWDRGGVLCRARPRLCPGPGRRPLDGDGDR